MRIKHKSRARLCALALVALLPVGLAMATSNTATASDPADIWGPAVRMVLSLIAVLAVLGGCAWLARRLRDGGAFKTGLIEVVSGISLGGREKVVLLRVGSEEVLVGISPAGMRPLHVLKKRPEPKQFDEYFEATQSMELPK